jgi:hypothetical protein
MRLFGKRVALLLAAGVLYIPAMPSALAQAQEPAPPVLAPPAAGKIQRLSLKDGSQLLGRIISVDSTTIQFESSLGVSTIPIDSIESVREEEPGHVRLGRYYFPNPNQTRLIFAPTGRQLKQGEGYFSDYWVFFPGVSVGLTNRFTMGGGVSILPGLSFDEQLYYVTPKIGIVQQPNFNAAVGALFVHQGFDEATNNAGVVYGIGTWGSTDNSFTAGLGYGFVDAEMSDRPVFMLGGEARGAPRISFVTENYVFPGGTIVIMGGIRFMGRDMSVDLAIASAAGGEDGGGCCLPFLGFVWKW